MWCTLLERIHSASMAMLPTALDVSYAWNSIGHSDYPNHIYTICTLLFKKDSSKIQIPLAEVFPKPLYIIYNEQILPTPAHHFLISGINISFFPFLLSFSQDLIPRVETIFPKFCIFIFFNSVKTKHSRLYMDIYQQLILPDAYNVDTFSSTDFLYPEPEGVVNVPGSGSTEGDEIVKQREHFPRISSLDGSRPLFFPDQLSESTDIGFTSQKATYSLLKSSDHTQDIRQDLVSIASPRTNKYSEEISSLYSRWDVPSSREQLVQLSKETEVECKLLPSAYLPAYEAKDTTSLTQKDQENSSTNLENPTGSSPTNHTNKIPPPATKVQTLQCQTCKYTFARRSNLIKHVSSIHQTKRRFGCVQCAFRFKRRDHLVKHIKTVHLHLRQHSCDICGVLFAEKYNRNYHKMNIHEKKRPIQCGCGAYHRDLEKMENCLRCKQLSFSFLRNVARF